MDGNLLKDQELRGYLSGISLGLGSLTIDTIDYIGDHILHNKPLAILELGSGISTLCLAALMKRVHGSGSGPYVYSVEQDMDELEKTNKLLASHDCRFR